jgi:hypothetical protein
MDIQYYLLEANGILSILCLCLTLWVYDKKPEKERRYLWVLLLAAILIQVKMTQFHHTGIVHPVESIVRQTGSKFFKQTGYNNLYPSIAQAIKEIDPTFKFNQPPKNFRNPSTAKNEPPLLDFNLYNTEAYKSLFNAQEWEEFKKDIILWEKKFSPNWEEVLTQKDYNQSPAWTIWGHSVSRNLHPDSAYLLALLDILILLAIFIVLRTGTNTECALYGMIVAAVIPPTDYSFFSREGGALLTTMWVLWLSIGLTALKRRWYKLAGAAMAVATAEETTTAFFLAAALIASSIVTCKGWKLKEVNPLQPTINLVLGTTIAILTLLLVSNTMFGMPKWVDFYKHTQRVADRPQQEQIGWKEALQFHPAMENAKALTTTTAAPDLIRDSLQKREDWIIYRAWQVTMLLVILVWAIRDCRTANQTLITIWGGGAAAFLLSGLNYNMFLALAPMMTITAYESKRIFIKATIVGIIILTAFLLGTEATPTLISQIICLAITWTVFTYWVRNSNLKDLETPLLIILGALTIVAMKLPNIHGWEQSNSLLKIPQSRSHPSPDIFQKYLSPEGFIVEDYGTNLLPSETLSLDLKSQPPEKKYTINIRVFQKNKGILRAKNDKLEDIKSWDIGPEGPMFLTLKIDPTTTTERLHLSWEGAPSSSIQVYSAWKERIK